ncbi:MAG: L,D-transpeptidase family protein [Candidatus Omnitrophota bacterium]|nr:MAG: L,D-transpeptidase family protein [Candidatus Omnitrophota bacterium]
MNKKAAVIFLSIALAIILLSSIVRSTALKRSLRHIDRIDSENKQSLLILAKNFEAGKDYLKAKKALEKFIENSPYSSKTAEIQKDIENLNIKILFSDIMTDNDVSYKIQPGDTLAKIASKFNTTVELLKESNNLRSDLILPGKFLKVNRGKFSILVDKSKNELTLKESDSEIVKTYLVSTGENFSTPIGIFKIEEKLVSPAWYRVGAIVEPDSPEYELGSRWMGLSVSGYGIHGTKEASSIGKYITRGCVRMRNEDVEELYAIVPAGTEVVIVE